eukprot:gene13983-14098_t
MYCWDKLLALSWLLLAVWMTCTAAQAVRPTVPRTFVKLETSQFPTYAGPCSKATATFKVPSNKYPTVQAALAAAKPFTRIVVAPGVYDFSPMWDLPGVDIQVNDLCLTGAGPRKTRPGGEGWGADAFAIESGRQIVATGITVSKATSDGIDIKAYDAVVTKCKVLDVGSNGIKLWAGGDVMDCVINGTGDYREAIAGTPVGRYRFQRVFITNHCKNGRSYLATWGYKTNQPTARIEFRNCTFKGNPNSGGFYMPDQTPLQLVNNVFWDVGTRLLQYGEDSLNLMVDAEGLGELEQRGLGSGNKLGGV